MIRTTRTWTGHTAKNSSDDIEELMMRSEPTQKFTTDTANVSEAVFKLERLGRFGMTRWQHATAKTNPSYYESEGEKSNPRPH